MSAVALHAAQDLPQAVRASGRLVLRLERHSRHGIRRDVHEEGASRLRFPRVGGAMPATTPVHAVSVNVGGGIAGGDRFSTRIECAENTMLSVSSAAAERVYRSAGGRAQVEVELGAAAGATLVWMPQETILSDGADLARSTRYHGSSLARFVMVEMLVLGRRESGETFRSGFLDERRDIRIDGRLVLAERLRLDAAALAGFTRPSCFGQTHALATILIAGPDAMERLEADRLRLAAFAQTGVDSAASAFSGLLVIRFRSDRAGALKAVIARYLKDAFPALVPRIWA